MLVGVLPILLAFFTLFTSFSSGVPIEEDSLVVRGTPTFGSEVISNAERIARRLPLSRPKRLFDAARPRVALAPRASCMPVPGDYKIEVYYATDVQFTTVIGYVSGNGFDQGSLETNINVAPTFSSPCTFDVDNQVLSSDFKLNGASYPYYMVRSPTGGDLGNGAGASAFGFTPDQAGDAGAQTTAFRVDSGGEITVTYTNTDGTTGQPKIYNYQGTFFASKSATDLANAFGLGVTEEDEVVWVFAKQ